MADAIASLVADRGADELGARAAERRRAEFDLAAMTRNVETLYEELRRHAARARRGRGSPAV